MRHDRKIQILVILLMYLVLAVAIIFLSGEANAAYIPRTWDRNETRIADMSRERFWEEDTGAGCDANTQNAETVIAKVPGKYSAITVTEADYELLAKIVYLEARGESAEGQQAVIEVIFNRVLDTRFPDTIEGVIYAPGQFCTVPMLDSAYPSEMQYAAIDAAMCSDGIVGDAIYFATRPLTKNCVRQIGCHYFCQ